MLRYTDAFLAATPPSGEVITDLRAHLSAPEIVELSLAVSLFHGFSKLMISLGLEPEHMETTVLPTPDTADVG